MILCSPFVDATGLPSVHHFRPSVSRAIMMSIRVIVTVMCHGHRRPWTPSWACVSAAKPPGKRLELQPMLHIRNPEHSKNLLSFIALALFFGTGSDNEGSDMTSVVSRARCRASEQPAVITDLSQPSGPGQVIIEPSTYLSISLQ